MNSYIISRLDGVLKQPKYGTRFICRIVDNIYTSRYILFMDCYFCTYVSPAHLKTGNRFIM